MIKRAKRLLFSNISTKQTIVKNMAVLMAAQVIVMILGLIFVVYVARFLGAEGFGKYNFALVFTGLFAVFADLGLSILTVREIARDKSFASKYITNTAIIKIILSVVTILLIVLIINLMNYPWDTTYSVYIFGLYVILISFSQIFRSIFKAFEVMEYESLITILDKLITVSLGLWVLFSRIQLFGSQLIAVVFVFLISGICDVIFSFIICFKKVIKINRRNLIRNIREAGIDFAFWRFLFKEAAPFAIQLIFGVIYFQIDIVMLSMMKGDAIVGIYSAAYNLIVVLLFIPRIIIMVLFPVMSKFFVSSRNSLKITLEKSIKYVFIIAFPIAIGITLLGDNFILLLYKEEFLLSVIALQILIWYIPIRFINCITSISLAAMDKAWIRTNAAIVCSFFNIGVNLVLIPMYSFKGAAIATILTEILLFATYFYFIRKYLYQRIISFNIKTLKNYAKIIVSGLLMGGFIYFIKNIDLILDIIYLVILVFLSSIIYFGALYILKGFSKEDKNILKKSIIKNI